MGGRKKIKVYLKYSQICSIRKPVKLLLFVLMMTWIKTSVYLAARKVWIPKLMPWSCFELHYIALYTCTPQLLNKKCIMMAKNGLQGNFIEINIPHILHDLRPFLAIKKHFYLTVVVCMWKVLYNVIQSKTKTSV